MASSKSALLDSPTHLVEISIVKSIFAKPGKYFVGLRLGDSAKYRTELVDGQRPLFEKNTFEFTAPGEQLDPNDAMSVLFAAFCVPEEEGGKATRLGTGSLDVHDYALHLMRGETVVHPVILRDTVRFFIFYML